MGGVVVEVGFEIGLGGDIQWDEESAFVGIALISGG